MNNEPQIAVIDMPIPELTTDVVATGKQLLAKAKRIYADEEDISKALPIYAKAATVGNVEAFMELSGILEEEGGGDVIQVEMVHALQEVLFPHKAAERDIEFVSNFLYSNLKDMSISDVKKLLHIAQYYDILQKCVEEPIEWIRNYNDAMNDDSWMFPDGHDDGEAIDVMRCDE